MTKLEALLKDVRACTICAADLPAGPRPVLQAKASARILIAGQAPGRKVHASGIPFDDASGDRLREWLGLSRQEFYDPKLTAIIPMGFCYPGTGKSGDLPPRSECSATWHDALLKFLPRLELRVVIGQYALDYHLGRSKRSLTERVAAWQEHWPQAIPLPHPSPRNNIWLRRNPWFEAEVIPALQQQVQKIKAA